MQNSKITLLLFKYIKMNMNDFSEHKKIDLDELKALQLGILQAVHDFCMENSIRYSLCGGTLLGAIRHKGYIPWDDDIDIMMPRPDYEKFHHLFNEQKDSVYKMISAYNDKQFFQPFGKVVDTRTSLKERYSRPLDNLGVNIDVFPVDGLPNDERERDSYWKSIKLKKFVSSCVYQRANHKEHGIKKIIRAILFFLFKPLPGNFFALRLHRIAAGFDFPSSKKIANSIFGYGRKEEMPVKLFDEFVSVDFEGKKINSVADWNSYLTNLFGDYMRLPPEESRIAKHDFEVHWK